MKRRVVHRMGSLEKTGTQWGPCLEWSLYHSMGEGNPFYLEASVTFVHKESGEKITTEMFYAGSNTWKFRFTGTCTGIWNFRTASREPALNGKTGEIIIESNPDTNMQGFVTSVGKRWVLGATGKAFVPQLVMCDPPRVFLDDPEKIDKSIKIFLKGHGFNGFHVILGCRWFDIDHPNHEEIGSSDPNPDLRTFIALEDLITKVYRAGGMVHLWAWGDNDPGHRSTPMREDWGGKNGRVDRGLQRYIAARLGPLPGWTMGYGFDLEHWVDERDLKEWHDNMHRFFEWPHLLGGRSGTPKWGNEYDQIYEGLDYAGYTHLRPSYDEYVRTLELHPDKPILSEDRFRIRDNKIHSKKDYNEDMTRRGLWHSAMAGGVGNICGNYGIRSDGQGISLPYLRKEWIKTYSKFFSNRFTKDMYPVNELTNHRKGVGIVDGGLSCCLMDFRRQRYVFYKKNALKVRMDLSGMNGKRRAKAVDTRTVKAYREIDIGTVNAVDQTWYAPYESDWAIAVEKEGEG